MLNPLQGGQLAEMLVAVQCSVVLSLSLKADPLSLTLSSEQWRRAIEALEARAPPDGVATLVNSLQNRVKSITLCVILNAKMGNSPCDAMHSD